MTSSTLTLEIDRPARAVCPGELITGRVRLGPDRPEYGSVTATLRWRVHGRGDPIEESVQQVVLARRAPPAEQAPTLDLAFRFRAPDGPPSCVGTLLELDWHVVGRAFRRAGGIDVAEAGLRLLAGDKADAEFGPRVYAPVGDGGSPAGGVVERLGRATGRMARGITALAELRTGRLDIFVFPDDPRPGESLGFEVAFTPPLACQHGRITLSVRCVEEVSRTSPTGTIVTRAERFKATVPLSSPDSRRGGVKVLLRGGLALPDHAPHSLAAGPHDGIRWTGRLDIPVRRWVTIRRVFSFRVHRAGHRMGGRTIVRAPGPIFQGGHHISRRDDPHLVLRTELRREKVHHPLSQVGQLGCGA